MIEEIEEKQSIYLIVKCQRCKNKVNNFVIDSGVTWKKILCGKCSKTFLVNDKEQYLNHRREPI